LDIFFSRSSVIAVNTKVMTSSAAPGRLSFLQQLRKCASDVAVVGSEYRDSSGEALF
jgi:hypothetical protein